MITFEMLKNQVGDDNIIDITGKKIRPEVKKELLTNGFKIHHVKVTKISTGKSAQIKLLSKAHVTQRMLWERRGAVRPLVDAK